MSDKIKHKLNLGMDIITIPHVVQLFGINSNEVNFFHKQISVYGLEDWHVTIVAGCTDEEKKEIVTEMIENWDDKGERITFL